MRLCVPACLVLALAGCATTPAPEPVPATAEPVADPGPPPPLRVLAASNDAWNAVGQILVRMPAVDYEGRSQMMGFYALRYRGTPMRIVTRALLLSDTVRDSTTEIAATLPEPTPAASADARELMDALQRELPAELERVKAHFAAEAAAKKAAHAKAPTSKRKQVRKRRK